MHTRHFLLFALLFTLAALLFVAPSQANSRQHTNLQYVPVTPCRVADTRLPDGPFGGPAIPGQTSRNFAIPNSACNIPGTAAAYSLNITVVPNGPLGYLTAWPAGQTQPVVSTLNSLNGQIKANAAIIGSGSNAAVSIYVTNTTNVVLDIDGYFAPATSSTLAFYPLTPCRVVDTRWPDGPLGGPYLEGGQVSDFPLLDSACAIPVTAQGYSLNLTVVPKGPLGYLTVWPAGQSKPLVSTLNALTGAITANAAIVPAGLTGAISVYPTNDTDLIIDIDGYFAPTNSGPGPSSLYTLTPCRVLDTRQTTGAFDGTITVDVQGSECNVPGGQAYVLNATVVPPGPLGYLTLWPDQEEQPVVSTLNAVDGAITSNMAIVPTLNGEIHAFATNPTNLVLDISGYFGAIAALTVTTSSLPSGTMFSNYSATLAATGGITPYSWSITSGSLPEGLSLDSSTGAITGAPTWAGTANFTVQVADGEDPPATATAQLSITIAPEAPLSITTTSLPVDTANTPYDATIIAIGGVTPYTWSVAAGSLPVGLSLNSSTGEITGTPTVAGTSSFTVQVADSEGPPATASAQLSITIQQGGGGDPGVLNGNYAFFLNGFSTTGHWTLAGSFVSDGKGNITSGVLDGNSVAGQPYNTAITGIYSITPFGLNSMTIQGQSWGPMTLAFVVSSSGNGRIIEYDDVTGQGSRGSGMLRKQDPNAFSTSKISGGYTFGMNGAGAQGERATQVGVYAINHGVISLGACMINDGGSYTLCTFTGAMSAVDPQTGRAATLLQSTGGTVNQAVYVVSAGELLIEQIDSVSDTGNPAVVGRALQQVGPFSNASLNGPVVFYYHGIRENTDQSGAMIVSFDGNGAFTVIASDENLENPLTRKMPAEGAYSVQADGTVTLTFDPRRKIRNNDGEDEAPAGYLIGQNQALLVGTGSMSSFGIMQPQTGGPFSNESVQGAYAGGSLDPLDYINAIDDVDTISADGLGTIISNDDSSGGAGLGDGTGNIINYTIAPNGRGTGTGNGGDGGRDSIVYMISPGKFVVLQTDAGAGVDVFEH